MLAIISTLEQKLGQYENTESKISAKNLNLLNI